MKKIALLIILLTLSINVYSKEQKVLKKPTDKTLIKKATTAIKDVFLKDDPSNILSIIEYPVHTNEFSEDMLYHEQSWLVTSLKSYTAHFKSQQDHKAKLWQMSCFNKFKIIKGTNADIYVGTCAPLKFEFKKINNDIKLIGVYNIEYE